MVLQIRFFFLSMGRRTSRCENSETNDEPKGGGGEDSREEEVKNKRVNSCETPLQKIIPFPTVRCHIKLNRH